VATQFSIVYEEGSPTTYSVNTAIMPTAAETAGCNITGDNSPYEAGDEVSLTANTVAGWAFSGWTGDQETTSATLEFEMPADDVDVAANFVRTLTLSGATADDKEYDGTGDATVDFSGASLVGVQPGDSVSIDGSSYSANFDGKNIGTDKTVTLVGVGLSGTDASKYKLSEPTFLTADITPKDLTVYVEAEDKVFDGTTAATLLYGGFIGKETGDDVWLVDSAVSANFDTAAVGTDKPVTVSGLTIDGTDAGNYNFLQPTGVTADILPASVPTPGITVTPTSGLETTESGGTDTFTVVLNTQPTDDVTIGLSSNDLTEGTVSPASLTFDPVLTYGEQTRNPGSDGDTWGSWTLSSGTDGYALVDDGQSSPDDASTYITGTAIDEEVAYYLFGPTSAFDIPDGATITDLTISFRARKLNASGSSDLQSAIKVNGSVCFDDSGHDPSNSGYTTYYWAWTTNPTTGSAWTEADIEGTGDHPLQQFGVFSFDLDPDIRTTMVAAVVHYTLGHLWSDPQTVTVTGVDDEDDDDDVLYSIVTAAATSTDTDYNGWDAPDVSVTNIDDDGAGQTGCTQGVIYGGGGIDNSTAAYDGDTGTATEFTGYGSSAAYYGFDFTPDVAGTITGIEVHLLGSTTGRDLRVNVGNGGDSWGTSKPVGLTGAEPAAYTVGGPDDTWGYDWTGVDFNDGESFRVIFVTTDGGDTVASLYEYCVTVYYSGEGGNTAPTITSNGGGATASTSADENTTAVTTVTATDPDAGDTLTFSISGGLDQSLFSINSSSGALTFSSAPNYESPTDNGANNVYDVQVTVTDDGEGNLTDTQDIAVTVNNVNDAPVITSDGGGASASVNAAENQTSVTTVTATDEDTGDTLTYSISGGADSALFSINSSTGVLTFVSAPNYEVPTDSGTNGVYDVQVTVTDNGAGSLTDVQAIAVTVTNVNENPVITSNGGGPTASTSVNENTTAVTTVTATDPDAGDTLTYSISGGVDSALFSINSSSGALTFSSAPNYESPTDSGANNVYDVQVTVTDDGTGNLTDTQAIAVTVNNVNDAPVITSDGGGASASVNAAENQTSVTTATATDEDTGDTLTYSISGGADSALFSINSSTGVLTFVSAPNYESPTDSGANGVYDVQVTVTDNGAGNLTDVQAIAVTVTNVNDAPDLTNPGPKTVEWGNLLSFPLSASDDDTGDTLTYSIQSTILGDMAVNSSTGDFSWTPTSADIGPHSVTFRVTDDGSPSYYDEETITITVEKRSTTLVYTGDLSVQYSDPASLSATLTDTGLGSPLASKAIVFTICGHSLSSVNTDGSGVAATTYIVMDTPGSYSVLSTFAEDALYKASSDSDGFTVSKEVVRVKYTGDVFKWVNKDETADTEDDHTSLNLKAILREDDDGNPGNLELAAVTFSLDAIIGSDPATSSYEVDVESSGAVQVTSDDDVYAGLYEIVVEVGSDYYTTAIDMRTISVPDWAERDSRVEGSGDIDVSIDLEGEPIYAANFGFAVEYGKKSPVGFFNFYYYVDGDDDGSADYLYVIKNNSWAKGGLMFDGDTHAYFESKATVKKFDLATGENIYTSGNGRFYVEVEADDGTQEVHTPNYIAVAIWDGKSIAFEIGTLTSHTDDFDGVAVVYMLGENEGQILVIP